MNDQRTVLWSFMILHLFTRDSNDSRYEVAPLIHIPYIERVIDQ